MSSQHVVVEKDLRICMIKIKELRRMALQRHLDPWALRQALVIALVTDTMAAIRRGIPKENLAKFDQRVEQDVAEWSKKIPS